MDKIDGWADGGEESERLTGGSTARKVGVQSSWYQQVYEVVIFCKMVEKLAQKPEDASRPRC